MTQYGNIYMLNRRFIKYGIITYVMNTSYSDAMVGRWLNCYLLVGMQDIYPRDYVITNMLHIEL